MNGKYHLIKYVDIRPDTIDNTKTRIDDKNEFIGIDLIKKL